MADLSKISNEEMLFDRQEAFNDLVAVLCAQSVHPILGGATGVVRERFTGNLHQIEVIRQECKRRGFDPAQYRGVVDEPTS